MWEPAKSAILDLTELAPDAPEITQLIAAVSAGQSKAAAAPPRTEATPIFIEEPTAAPAPAPAETAKPEITEPVLPPKPVIAEPAPVTDEPPPPLAQPAVAAKHEDVLEIPAPAKSAQAQPVAAAAPQSTEDILGDFVLDLEQSEELADFVPKQQPAPKPAPAAAAAAPAMEQRAVAPSTNGDIQDTEAANVLSDILSELQEENADAAEPEEDPETHYNLGIAFKEMGLLDEAIGELQKVCHAVDRGAAFSQPIQALTWLAQCLVDKGAPEAAVRWYRKALQLPGLDDGSRCAIYYDLATAYEASGDKKSALANFMEVYGSNIDFRDVASRIKALKS
jgi:tetratricopeptide (TPR) repeat protein